MVDTRMGQSPDELESSFRKLIEDFTDAKISYATVPEMFSRLKSHIELAEGHIHNAKSTKDENRQKFNDLINKSAIKESMNEHRVAPLELLDSLMKAYKALDEERIWDRLKIELLWLFTQPLYKEYLATKAFEVNDAVNKGFEERQQQWMELTKQMVRDMFNNVDNKFISMKDTMMDLNKFLTAVEKRLAIAEFSVEQLKQTNAKEIPPKPDDSQTSKVKDNVKERLTHFSQQLNDTPTFNNEESQLDNDDNNSDEFRGESI